VQAGSARQAEEAEEEKSTELFRLFQVAPRGREGVVTVEQLIEKLRKCPAEREVEVNVQLKSGDGGELVGINWVGVNPGSGDVLIAVEFDDVFEQ
jgi:hypothetical protein